MPQCVLSKPQFGVKTSKYPVISVIVWEALGKTLENLISHTVQTRLSPPIFYHTKTRGKMCEYAVAKPRGWRRFMGTWPPVYAFYVYQRVAVFDVYRVHIVISLFVLYLLHKERSLSGELSLQTQSETLSIPIYFAIIIIGESWSFADIDRQRRDEAGDQALLGSEQEPPRGPCLVCEQSFVLASA
jgi:hypothetical protein